MEKENPYTIVENVLTLLTVTVDNFLSTIILAFDINH